MTFWNMSTGDTAMETPSTSTTESEISRLGGVEALRLNAGPVRRNLFGPVDHQQLREDFQRLLCMGIETANKRWNYDFLEDTPGTGSNVQWEEVRCQDVPGFYRGCTVRPAVRSGKPVRRSSTSSGEDSPTSSSSSGSGDEYLEVTTRRCYRLKRPEKRRQAPITDFFKVKRRRLLDYKGSSRQ
ncbi:cyclin-dependent kinase inhibitor 1-like isoform X1 [Syngnathus acus]|uniref:cyclin-dependent kinase inhibitor 1-like isoform X1 n=2 Tax=Syngnathus acus TaxID=161584 RepID=UPI001886327D|nr:cyclin-dependent kinase inhibitor 1-like isoform X1 [Syngnathus acus]